MAPRTSLQFDVADAFEQWRNLKRQVESTLIDIGVDLDTASLDDVRSAIRSLDGEDIRTKLDIDDNALNAIESALNVLDQTVVTPKVSPDDFDVKESQRLLQELGFEVVQPKLEIADEEIERRRLELQQLGFEVFTPEIKPDDAEVRATQRLLEQLGFEVVTPKINVDDAEVEAARRELEELGFEVYEPKIEPDLDTEGIGDDLQSAVESKAAGITAAIAAAISVGIRDGIQRSDLQATVAVRFGLDAEAEEEVNRITRRLFQDGVGDSEGQVANVVGLTRQSLEDLDGDLEQLEELSLTALNIERAFADVGADSTEAINAAAQQVRNGLAPDLETAFAVIFAGFEGADRRSQDLLDTYNEYSVTLRALGLSAQDFLSLTESGLDAGARDTDRIADAFLELRVRTVEDTAAVNEALAGLSLPDSVIDDLASGGEQARTAVQEILDALAAVEDEALRDNIVRELFGTPGEELTFDVVSQFQLANESAVELLANVEDANARLETGARGLSGAYRQARGDFAALVTGDQEALQIDLEDIDVTLSPELEQERTDAIAEDVAGRFQDALDGVGSRITGLFPDIVAAQAEAEAAADVQVRAIESAFAQAEFGITPRINSGDVSIDGLGLAFEVETAVRVNDLEIAEGAVDALNTRLGQIDAQLDLSFTFEEPEVNDLQEIVDQATAQAQEFIDRSNTATDLDILGFGELAERVNSGEFDEALGDIQEAIANFDSGGEALLADAEASIAAAAELQAAAAAEAVAATELAVAEAIATGENPFVDYLTDIDITAEDLVEFGAKFRDAVSEQVSSDAARTQINNDGIEIAVNFAEGLSIGIAQQIAGVEDAVATLTAAMVARANAELGIESPSREGIAIGSFFDEGVAEGILSGRTPEAAERLTEGIISAFNALEDIDFSQSFSLPEFTIGDDGEEIARDPEGDLAAISSNIRQQIDESVQAAQAQVDLLVQREDAIARLDQFGGFDAISEYIESGALDDNLSTIINAPNEALFAQIENDLTRGAAILDPSSLISDQDVTGLRARGEESGFNVVEGFKQGVEGDSSAAVVLRQFADDRLADLNDRFGIRSPSEATRQMGVFLDQGLAEGLLAEGFTQTAIETFTLTAAGLLSEEEGQALTARFSDLGIESGDGFTEQVAEAVAGTDASGVTADFSGLTDQIIDSIEASDAAGLLDDALSNVAVGQIDDSEIDELDGTELSITADVTTVDVSAIDNVTDQDRTLEYSVVVDASEVDALEQRVLQMTAEVNPTLNDPAGGGGGGGGPTFFDKGGVAYGPTLAVLSERFNEAVIGPHHSGEDKVRWAEEVGALQNMLPVIASKYGGDLIDMIAGSRRAAAHANAAVVNVDSSPLAAAVSQLKDGQAVMARTLNEIRGSSEGIEFNTKKSRGGRRAPSASEKGLWP